MKGETYFGTPPLSYPYFPPTHKGETMNNFSYFIDTTLSLVHYQLCEPIEILVFSRLNLTRTF